MVQIVQSALDEPRISANQLGEFAYASEKRRFRILHDCKFGNPSAAPYYSTALTAVRRALVSGQFSGERLVEAADALDRREAKTRRQSEKWANNALALRQMAHVCAECDPPAGEHRVATRNAQFGLDGVTVSVLPDFVTENIDRGYIAFTKLRFSKSKIAADVSEIVLLLLHYYGQRQSRAGLQFDFDLTKVIDPLSRTIIPGHAIGRHRDQQLHDALRLVKHLWPRIEPLR